MVKLSTKAGLDRFYSDADPWGYFKNPHDLSRQRILLDELSRFNLGRVLDIGCGNGFITNMIEAEEVVGIDISTSAIQAARECAPSPRIKFIAGSLFDLPSLDLGQFDTVIITGVLYPQYIGQAHSLVYLLTDQVLRKEGTLVSVHIDEWYQARFPYALTRALRYSYREYTHLLEIYRK